MKRVKKILKWTAVILGALVAILLVVNAWFVWTTDTRLEEWLAKLRAAGEPLSLAELARPPIPPERNAATYLRRAEADTRACEDELIAALPKDQYPPPFPLSGEELKIVQATFDAHPKVIPLLQQAVACPDYDAQLDYTLAPREFIEKLLEPMQRNRSFARLLYTKSLLHVAQGNYDEGVQMAIITFRLARHFQHSPLLIGWLVATAIRGMAVESANMAMQSGPVSPEVRKALDAELAQQELMEGYGAVVSGERAFSLDSFRSFPHRNFWLVSRGFWNVQELAYFELVDAFAMLPGDSRPLKEIEPIIKKTGEQIRSNPLTVGGALAQVNLPAVIAAHRAVVRTKALVRCLRVLNALQSRGTAQDGEVPKLGELGLPEATTVDPYTGEPLHVKKTPQGWLVYCVGPNFKDDGGDIHEKHDKNSDVYEQPTDIGVGPLPATDNSSEGQ